jgi:hypothetical protein
MSPVSTKATVTADFTGPFFQKDPEKTILQNVSKMMKGVAEEGAAAAREGLLTGSGGRAPVGLLGDRVADHVIGRTESRAGRLWTAAAVVQVLNEGFSAKEGTSLMAAASIVESRTKAISRVTRQLRAARAVLRANLTEGLE